jgi:hypothetical protein
VNCSFTHVAAVRHGRVTKRAKRIGSLGPPRRASGLTARHGKDASPAQANPIRPRYTNGGGHPSGHGEACHRRGSNEQRHSASRSG